MNQKVSAEQQRAEAEEQRIESEITGALSAEIERALSAEALLDEKKAGKILVPGVKRLMDAEVGDLIDGITFDTNSTPVLEQSAINTAAGNFVSTDTEFSFVPAVGNPVIFFSGGQWLTPALSVFENPGMTVTESLNANGGIWEQTRYGSRYMELEDLRDSLHQEVIEEKNRATLEENTIKTSLAGLAGTAGNAVGQHNTDAEAHQDIRAVLAAIHAWPTVDGEYKLQVAGGVLSWVSV
jgi:hypothetical protein